MAKRKNIAPKPTKYRGVLFRSRLEAKWAVILDNLPNVLHWTYEPKTYTLPDQQWQYTPDFHVICFWGGGRHQIYFEVKPGNVTTQYRDFLCMVAQHAKWPIVLWECSLYFRETKQITLAASQFHKGCQGKSQPFNFPEAFPELYQAVGKSAQYRFDLA